MAKVLVTGGAGFIGSHLVEALFNEGHFVRVLDDLSTGKANNVPSGVELVKGSVEDSSLVAAALNGMDVCFHLAAVASVARSIEQWGKTSSTNILGTGNIFEQCSRLGRIPVVYASSAAVYGNALSVPIEETVVVRPLSPYGADKAASELYAYAAHAVHGTASVGLRFFNVYGPRQDPSSQYSGVISIFCARLTRGEAVEIFGDGSQSRDFINVRDVISALLAAMTLARRGGAHIFNVCTGVQVSIIEVARLLEDILGVQDRIRNLPAREGDIHISCGNPGRLNRGLGVVAKVGLREGLVELLSKHNPGSVK